MSAAFRTNKFSFFTHFLTMFVLAAFLVVSFLGVFDCMSRLMHPMGMSEMTSVMDCSPLLAQKGGCSMNLLEHLSIWQGAFRANLQSDVFFLLALVLVISYSVTFVAIAIPQAGQLIKPKLYLYLHRDLKLYNYFLDLFSHGILQRRVYA